MFTRNPDFINVCIYISQPDCSFLNKEQFKHPGVSNYDRLDERKPYETLLGEDAATNTFIILNLLYFQLLAGNKLE